MKTVGLGCLPCHHLTQALIILNGLVFTWNQSRLSAILNGSAVDALAVAYLGKRELDLTMLLQVPDALCIPVQCRSGRRICPFYSSPS